LVTPKNPLPRNLLSALCAGILFTLFLAGCSSGLLLAPPQETGTVSPIRVTSRDNSVFRFQENDWRLTFEGIAGTAEIETEDGVVSQRDTTLAYWDVAAASGGGRRNTMTQFLLTILGVILVIGLAAIILYAAFLATDR